MLEEIEMIYYPDLIIKNYMHILNYHTIPHEDVWMQTLCLKNQFTFLKCPLAHTVELPDLANENTVSKFNLNFK
jgi:hypothetical protein